MSKIDIDLSAWLDNRGVTTTVYVGDTSEPTYYVTESYKELVDSNLHAHKISNGKIPRHHWDDLEDWVQSLIELGAYALERFDELKDDE